MDNVKTIGHFYVLGCSWRYTGMIHLLFVFAVSCSWLFFLHLHNYWILFLLFCYVSCHCCVMLFFCIILVLFITDHLFTWQPAIDKVVLNCIVCLQDQYSCNIIAPMKHSFIELRQLKQPENLIVFRHIFPTLTCDEQSCLWSWFLTGQEIPCFL